MPSSRFSVLIAGGGIAGIEAALAIRHLAPRAAVEVVTPDAGFTYRQLSVLEPFTAKGTRRVSYDELRDRDIAVTRAVLSRVDPLRRQALLAGGDARGYDALLVAAGAMPKIAFERAITFTGPKQAGLLHDLVAGVERGAVRRVAFVVPAGITWPLPVYELALQLAERARATGVDAELRVVTPEEQPLGLFGPVVGEHVAAVLAHAGVLLDAGVVPDVPAPGVVVAGAAGERAADRVVALPVLTGRRFAGLPTDPAGFIPVDGGGRVAGTPAVYAAGDGTGSEIKQGGVAAQNADRAAATLLADGGFAVAVPAGEPELRAVLIAGGETWYLRRLPGSEGEFSPRPLWWPPSKVVGRHLSPFLDGLTADEPDASLERGLAAAQLEGTV